MILGDMFEMGSEAAVEHTAVIEKAMQAAVNEVIFIGKDFSSQQTEVQNSQLINTTFYITAEDAMVGLKTNPISNATILIKGSRGMALERLVELF
jgi:UDP-N-acetylmuramoyl-tripeptide--D-alanyl-D-alanine ligase